ncbi:hypothetical protein PSPO01_13229 [Paraphaeosphaeria sporulosa]
MTDDLRPIQWKGVARHLQYINAGIAASILAADCNANRPRDGMDLQKNGFKGAHLELGGVEDERGVEMGDVLARRTLERKERLTFVTDHYGLMGIYSIKGEFA